MRELAPADTAQLAAELVAELYRGKILTRPVNAAWDGNAVIDYGQLFKNACSYIDGVEDYQDSATAGVIVPATAELVSICHKLEIGSQDWDAIYRWACDRVETATTEEEAR